MGDEEAVMSSLGTELIDGEEIFEACEGIWLRM